MVVKVRQSASMVSNELHVRIVEHVEKLYQIADAKLGKKLRRPAVIYKNRSSMAGTCRPRTWELSLNPVLLLQNTEAFFHDTIPHEIGHFIAKEVWGSVGHDQAWKDACELVGLVDAKQFHKYDVSSVKIRQQRYVYRCDCAERLYTATRHNRIQAGKKAYRCVGCNKLTSAAVDARGNFIVRNV